MIKDNHKNFFGGVKEAIDFFRNVNSFYTPLVLEIHSIRELKEAINLNVLHVMLDNFDPEQILEAVKIKPEGMTFEVSGGISLNNLNDYLIDGVDAISSGSLTYNAKQVDISLKYHRPQ
jgi:nicotinate-nucleotide pyrophosphorylase (carboxylating)